MLLDRWRARRALLSRSAPSPVDDPADPRLRRAVEELQPLVGALDSLGDPIWHQRWEGELQLVGLDARTRSTSDVRQRLLRLVHELALRHMHRRARRVLAVVLCEPAEGEGLAGWHARLEDDRGEVGEGDWHRARSRVAVLALGSDGSARLFGGDPPLAEAVERWQAARRESAPPAAS